jgi:TAP-like protein
MIVTVEAEDAFDVSDRLGEIRAPTLVIGGERDPGYSRELFEETARGIPDARLFIYEGRGHGGTVTDRRFARDVTAFLVGAGRPAPGGGAVSSGRVFAKLSRIGFRPVSSATSSRL